MTAPSVEGVAEDPWAADLNIDDAELQRLLDAPSEPVFDCTRLRANGFNNNAGQNWFYPNNLPERAYQMSIVHAALFRNTLVVLPTGLGKTFIAAVVMYNIYRWYPTSKVVFMAPTRPLVAQQITACQRIMPFPAQDTVELTGKLQRARRTELWRSKRVFFATPQVVQSDIMGAAETESEFPFGRLRLIVIDEAHRAKGRYAYTEVAKAIWQRNRDFRVLALSATPGRTIDDVAEVVRNLYISHLEVRSDCSIDVQPYIHKRNMRTVVVPLGDEIKALREELLQIIDPYLRQLVEAGVLHTSLSNITRNLLLYEQKRFRERTQQQRHPQQAAINSNFSICISLCHALELLERHGMRVFLNSFEDDEDGRSKFVLNMERRLRELVERLRTHLGPNPFDVSARAMTNGEIAEMPQDLDFGHPKFEEARKCVMQHFEAHSDARAIVFCEYRESVMLIYRLLLQHAPLLKPRCFVGQGGSSGALRALTQKQQIQIMKDFRTGKSNVLIATSIGEEGIDVGEVDLIVCFDISTSNPTRFVQRIGRTGRQKQGNVVMLVTEGREQRLLKDALAQKDQTNKKLLQSSVVRNALYQHAPRLVPTEFNPQCMRVFIKPTEVQADSNEQAEVQSAKATKKKTAQAKKTKNQPITGSQDLRKFFKLPPVVPLDAAELEIFEAPRLTTAQTTGKTTDMRLDELFPTLDVAEQPSCSAATPAQAKPVDRKRERRVDKILQSSTPLVPESERVYDFHAQLKLKDLSQAAKRFLLKSRPEFVRQICTQIDILGALDVEADTVMLPEERELRANYELVETICGGSRADIQQLLDEVEEEQFKSACTAQAEPDWNELVNSSSEDEQQFEAWVDTLFEGLEDRGVLCDNFDYIQQQLKKTQLYQNSLEEQAAPLLQESMVYETINETQSSQCSNENYTITDSKYCSQWDDFAKRELPHKSTPLQQGPLARSFQRQQQKQQMNSTKLLYSLIESPEKVFKNVAKADSLQKSKPNSERANAATKERVEKNTSVALQPHIKNSTIQGVPAVPQLNQTAACATSAAKVECTPAQAMLDELNFDLDAFFAPFPEEQSLKDSGVALPTTKHLNVAPVNSVLAENKNFSNKLANTAGDAVRQSPDIFEQTRISPANSDKAATNNKPQSLAAKLAFKRVAEICAQPKHTDMPRTPTKSNNTSAATMHESAAFTSSVRTPALVSSPKHQPINTNTPQYQKSPSIFDLYLKSMRGRSQQMKSSFLLPAPTSATCSSAPTQADNDESVIVRQPRTAKRRIIDSDSSVDEQAEQQTATISVAALAKRSSETDVEEIIATQQPPARTWRQRKKRPRRNCSFVLQEAAVSGSDHSADELEHAADNYLLDSVVVSSADEEEHDAVSHTHMQAIYLQSLKSPRQRAGAFKIPAHRVYNDHNHIFSQAIPIEPSQYLPDSFIVNEDEAEQEANVSMCPLERAERILKERRAKRKFAKVTKKAQPQLQRIAGDSSSDEFM